MFETLSSHAQEGFSNELCSLASLSDPFSQCSGSVISEESEALPWANIFIVAFDLVPTLAILPLQDYQLASLASEN